jgi:hypothetical protein
METGLRPEEALRLRFRKDPWAKKSGKDSSNPWRVDLNPSNRYCGYRAIS